MCPRLKVKLALDLNGQLHKDGSHTCLEDSTFTTQPFGQST